MIVAEQPMTKKNTRKQKSSIIEQYINTDLNLRDLQGQPAKSQIFTFTYDDLGKLNPKTFMLWISRYICADFEYHYDSKNNEHLIFHPDSYNIAKMHRMLDEYKGDGHISRRNWIDREEYLRVYG